MEHIALEHAAELIEQADALVIAAGAGMGVDSGMPDFRGQQGFWAAYPALAAAGIDFTSIANPKGFVQDASRAWGFYGHRLARTTKQFRTPGSPSSSVGPTPCRSAPRCSPATWTASFRKRASTRQRFMNAMDHCITCSA